MTRKIEEYDKYGLDYQEDDANNGQTTANVFLEILFRQFCHESWIVTEHNCDATCKGVGIAFEQDLKGERTKSQGRMSENIYYADTRSEIDYEGMRSNSAQGDRYATATTRRVVTTPPLAYWSALNCIWEA